MTGDVSFDVIVLFVSSNLIFIVNVPRNLAISLLDYFVFNDQTSLLFKSCTSECVLNQHDVISHFKISHIQQLIKTFHVKLVAKSRGYVTLPNKSNNCKEFCCRYLICSDFVKK